MQHLCGSKNAFCITKHQTYSLKDDTGLYYCILNYSFYVARFHENFNSGYHKKNLIDRYGDLMIENQSQNHTPAKRRISV